MYILSRNADIRPMDIMDIGEPAIPLLTPTVPPGTAGPLPSTSKGKGGGKWAKKKPSELKNVEEEEAAHDTKPIINVSYTKSF